ncbi:MAG: hypothetical protein D6714_10600 [Bacteroidetes bacterium]|nr:MAG: hypothetical protein D6714_10600 [Bacteroidota bacterium]
MGRHFLQPRSDLKKSIFNFPNSNWNPVFQKQPARFEWPGCFFIWDTLLFFLTNWLICAAFGTTQPQNEDKPTDKL